jgi:biotin carboxyl carrier protein
LSLEIRIDGRTRTVAIAEEDRSGHLAVTVDGRPRRIDAAWIDPGTLSVIAEGVVYEVRIRPNGAGSAAIDVAGAVFQVDVVEAARGYSHASDAGARKQPSTSRSRTIAAPMPGRIVRVLVAVGDRVAARQGMVIVEAMKMENVLRAPAEGIVKEVRVHAGSTVEAGAVLAVLD